MTLERSIAIVDDSPEDFQHLESCLKQYAEEKKQLFHIKIFQNGLDFLEEYHANYDVVFLDVEMPHIDGINTAKKLRAMDEQVVLVFVTRMAQYAISGYEVQALDFMLKPIRYGTLEEKLDRMLTRVDRQRETERVVLLNLGTDAFRKVYCRDIYYIIKDKNYLLVETKDGEYRVRGTLKDIADTFEGTTIVKCANGCMVNMRYIEQKVRSTVYVQGIQFAITKPYLDSFTESFIAYLRGDM